MDEDIAKYLDGVNDEFAAKKAAEVKFRETLPRVALTGVSLLFIAAVAGTVLDKDTGCQRDEALPETSALSCSVGLPLSDRKFIFDW